MIIKQNLDNLWKLVQEYGLNIKLNLVSLNKNKANILTLVRKSWISSIQDNKHGDICKSGRFHNLKLCGSLQMLYLA